MGFFSNCCKKTTGGIILGFGVHEVEIDVLGEPCKVSFEIDDPADGCCVCHGGVNKIGITIGNNGFIINADIQTNSCLIKWRCEYK
jgi:hypothetical protein